MKISLLASVFAMLGLVSLQVEASPILTVSPTVTTVDRAATFDSLTSTSVFIGFYTEDGLSVATPINQASGVGFTPFAPGDTRDTAFYYGSGGSNSYVAIKATDGAVFTALDLLIGDGEAPLTTNLRWQTFLSGSLTGTGFQSMLTKGVTIGWADPFGFDELRVAASGGSGVGAFSPNYLPGFGNFQSIAVDDVRVQLVAVPEPSTLLLLATGLPVVAVRRRVTRRSLTPKPFVPTCEPRCPN